MHFGMTGLLSFSSASQADHPDDRIVLQLDSGELRYRAMRKLGDPRADPRSLGEERVAKLSEAMDEVLREANRHRRVPALDGWLTGARDEDEPACPRCGAALERGTVAGRTSRWCPAEQTAPR